MPVPRRPRPSRRAALLRAAAAAATATVVAVPVPALAAPATGETVVGVLVQAWPEHEDPAAAAARGNEGPLSWIETADGGSVRVPTDQLEDAADVPVGATVEVTVGRTVVDEPSQEDGLDPARAVLAAEVVVPPAPAEPPTAGADQAPTDEVTVVTVAPRGTTPDGVDVSTVVATVNGAVASFWSGQSDGTVRIRATAGRSGWATAAHDCSDPQGFWQEVANSLGWQRDSADPGAPARHLLIYVPSTATSCAYGLGEVGASRTSGGRLYVRDTAVPVIAHELGHNFGLGHSSELQCDGTVEHGSVAAGSCSMHEYNDWYDVMGFTWDELGTLNAAQADRLRLLPSGEKVAVNTWSPAATYSLVPVSSASGQRAVELTDPYRTEYWLEYRQPSGQDAWLGDGRNWPGLDSGVTLRRSDTTLYARNSSQLLDGTPSVRSAWAADRRTALPVGRAVRVHQGDFTVTVQSVSPTAAVVRVSPGATSIGVKYAALGGPGGSLGAPRSTEACGLRGGGCYRVFAGGSVYSSSSTPAATVTGRVRDRWRTLGWEVGSLGYPVTDTVCGLAGGGCAQHFQGGSLYAAGTGPARVVNGAIRDRWLAMAAENGAAGYPVSDPACGLRSGGCFQLFQHGSMYWTAATGARFVRTAIRDRWGTLGWEVGSLGYPVTDTVCGLVGGGCAQHFQGGSLYSSAATPVRLVNGLIRDRWLTTGGERGAAGYPVSDPACGLPYGGCYQLFRNGSLYWSPATGAHFVGTVLRTRWGVLGWEAGVLGYPVTDTVCGLAGGGCAQHFQGGSLYSGAADGSAPVAMVRGAFRDRWLALRGENGRLGYPTSGQTCGLRGGGCAQHFQNGSLYWSSATGLRAVSGPMRTRYLALGGENGSLGYPVMDTFCGLVDNGCYEQFQGGTMYTSPRSPEPSVVRGAIARSWARTGFENGALGYPTADERCAAGGCYQRFENGTITWTPRSGPQVLSPVAASAWLAEGGPSGVLGYPRSRCTQDGSSGESCPFPGGTLHVDRETGGHWID